MSHNVLRLPAFVDGIPQTVVWRFDSTVPYSIRLILRVGYATVIRFVSRDLIRTGLDAPAGTRGVKVESGSESVRFRFMSSRLRLMVVEFGRANVEQAIRTSFLMVPEGTEAGRIDWGESLDTIGGAA